MQDQVLECDVVVVGARCAGAATAMLLAAAGHEVVVVDRAAVSSDTLSTHGMARGAVVQLARWGLLNRVLATGATASRQVTFGVGGEEVTRPVKDCSGVDLLLAPRRHVLDAVLAEAAVAAGARLLERTAVVDVLRSRDRVTGVIAQGSREGRLRVRARYVVGADGLRSTVARLVSADASRCFWSDSGTFYTYVDEVEWQGFEFHVADRAIAGVFPSHGTQACVWLIRPESALAPVVHAGRWRRDALLAEIAALAPALGDRLRCGRAVEPVRGAARLPNVRRCAHGPSWALVGDAGYHRDPLPDTALPMPSGTRSC
jgi:flavin-dependent dehydrogenase